LRNNKRRKRRMQNLVSRSTTTTATLFSSFERTSRVPSTSSAHKLLTSPRKSYAHLYNTTH
uniref:Ovule protein n=1 Tax=Angiostrongylus cantonensis TaxID=6313 RepID=A0A0K0DGI2_ANGCA